MKGALMKIAGKMAVLAVLLASTSTGRGELPPAARALLGQKVPNLAFSDASGQTRRLYDLRGQKALVLVFLSFDCPVSNSYCQPLADLYRELHTQGVTLLGLTVNLEQTPAEVAQQAREFRLPFPVYRDQGLKAAEALQAQATPEVFVLDGNYVLRYRGRIDDAWVERLKPRHTVTRQDLRQALSEVLSGRPVSVPWTEPVGCAIPRPAPPPSTGPVTFYRDVLPILQKHCQECHRPGQVGPFSLLTYRQAVNWGPDIKEYTRRRLMPPWKVTGGEAFHNERRLSEKEIAVLAAWVDGGMPAGNPGDAPPPRQFPAEGWRLGPPDLVLQAPAPFQLGPVGKDVFRCFVLPTGLTEDRYVAAVEVRPGNPRIVHHTLQFLDTQGRGQQLEQKAQSQQADVDEHGQPILDRGPGYSMSMGIGFIPQGGLGGWAPGQVARYLPEGLGYFLPRGADVVMQVHYHRNGRLEKDQTQIGLYFARQPCRPIQGGTLFGSQSSGNGPFRFFFAIPAGAEHFRLTGRQWAADDFLLYTLTPHMHLLGKAIKVTLTPPGGKPRTLLEIAQWDYNWQETYFFKEPVRVPAGSCLEVEAIYDNSRNNPRNPFDPPRRITFGEQTTNEMCFVFLGGISARPGRRLPLRLTEPETHRPVAAP
jgi:peroxiredoxin